jgi:type II secretory pathway component PulC
MRQKGSRVQGFKKNQKLMFLLFPLIFYCLLSTVYCLLSYAEVLSDVNLERLKKPAEDRPKERWGRDPFIKYEDRNAKGRVKPREIPFLIKIDGIISDGKKAVVIINGGFYRKGDIINNFIIRDISKEKVLLEKDGKKYYLGMERFALRGPQTGEEK